MDEYKEYLYKRNPDRYSNVDVGDLSVQKGIRNKLKCKSFKWFMETVAFDLPRTYPPVEPTDYAYGVIKSVGYPYYCIDTLNRGEKEPIGLFACSNNRVKPQGNQFFALSWHKDIRQKGTTHCWDVSESGPNSNVLIYSCHGSQGNQYWRYNVEKKWIMQGKNNRCLDMDPTKEKVFVNECRLGNRNMQWEFGYVNSTAIDNWDTSGVQEKK